jgi:hypothetical protein
MRIGLILIDALQCDRICRASSDRLFVSQELFVRVSINTSDFEEIQRFFDCLILNDSNFAKYECLSLVCTKKFVIEDHVIVENVLEILNDHFESKIFSFADSLLDFDLDE